jgi:tetratricopeptide (TPR) repeat protein
VSALAPLLHSGPVNEVTDLNEQANIAGAGINIAQRVMDCGDAGHILVSKHAAEDLEQYDQWQPYLHDLGECEGKHGERLHVVNLYNNEIGNPAVPTKCARNAIPGATSSAAAGNRHRYSIVAYAEAVRLDPQFALAWARLAVARSQLYFNGVDLETNSGAAVKEAADRAISLQPELGEAWLAQGVYRYRVLRDFQGALQSYQEALRRLPHSAFVLEQMAHLERRLGQPDVAQKHYQRAAQLDPRNIGILLTLVDTIQTVRRYDEARAVIDRVLEMSPGNEAALSAKATSLQGQGRLKEAAEVLAKAPANSKDEGVTVLRALQLYYERRFDEAIAQIQQNTPEEVANDPRTMTLLGYCQKFADKDNDARATFTRAAGAMKPTPDSVVVVDARQLPCYLAWVYAGLGEKEKALEQARHAISDYESDALVKPFAEASLAIVQAQLGDIDSAISALPHLLEVPNGETCSDLQFNPLWDPLRKDPRFQKLCAGK